MLRPEHVEESHASGDWQYALTAFCLPITSASATHGSGTAGKGCRRDSAPGVSHQEPCPQQS